MPRIPALSTHSRVNPPFRSACPSAVALGPFQFQYPNPILAQDASNHLSSRTKGAPSLMSRTVLTICDACGKDLSNTPPAHIHRISTISCNAPDHRHAPISGDSASSHDLCDACFATHSPTSPVFSPPVPSAPAATPVVGWSPIITAILLIALIVWGMVWMAGTPPRYQHATLSPAELLRFSQPLTFSTLTQATPQTATHTRVWTASAATHNPTIHFLLTQLSQGAPIPSWVAGLWLTNGTATLTQLNPPFMIDPRINHYYQPLTRTRLQQQLHQAFSPITILPSQHLVRWLIPLPPSLAPIMEMESVPNSIPRFTQSPRDWLIAWVVQPRAAHA